MNRFIQLAFTILFASLFLFACSKNEPQAEPEALGEELEMETSETVEDEVSAEPENILLSGETDKGTKWRVRVINPLENQSELTQELLLSTQWVVKEGEPRFIFFKDNIVLAGYVSSGQAFKGSYEILDGKLIITVLECPDWFKENIPVADTMELSYDPEYRDFNHVTRIKSTSDLFDLFPAGLESKVGDIFDLNGVETMKLEASSYAVLDYVKMRVSPSTESSIVENIYGEPLRADFRVDHILPGDSVTVLGKSTSEETIDGVTAYWFFCRHGVDQYGTHTAWVFGGDLEEYEKNKANEYKQQFDFEVQKCRFPEGGV